MSERSAQNSGTSAVREGRVHEVDATTLLSPGPALLTGLRTVHELEHAGDGHRAQRTHERGDRRTVSPLCLHGLPL